MCGQLRIPHQTPTSLPWRPTPGKPRPEAPERLLDQIRDLSQRPDHQLLVAADGHGSAQRMADALRAENIDLTLNQSERYEERPGGHIVTAPLEHGFIAPTLSLAVLTERDLTGRRRTHRISRPKKNVQRHFEDL